MDWCSYKVRQGHKVGVWKIIRKGWDLVGSNVFLEVGDGRRVKFWKDKQCGMNS